MKLKYFAISLVFILASSTTVLFAQSFSFAYSGPTSLTVPFAQNSVNGTYYFEYNNPGDLIRPKLIIAVNGNLITNDLCTGSDPFLPSSYTIPFSPGSNTVQFSLLSVNPRTLNCLDPIIWQVEQFTVTCNFQIQVKNIFEQGIISVDNVIRNSPYNRTTNVNQNIPVGAIDQDYQNYNRKWNSSGNNLSLWDRERNGNGIWLLQNWNRNFTYTVEADDKNRAVLRAGLRRNFAISRNDQKEFDGTSSAGVVTHIVEQNSGNVPVLSPFNLNGRSYKFGHWIGTSGDNFMPNDNTTLTAFYKAENLSNNSTTFSNNNQKKVAWSGWKVYESSGSIWLERNNQLMNNGRPANNLAEGPEAKSPSLDYILNSSYESTIYITYQQKTANGKYKIKLAKFNNLGQLIFNVDVFTSTIDFSAIDAAPVIAVTKSPALANGKPKFLIVWKQKAEGSYQDGLYYFGGVDNGSNVTWYYLPPHKFTSTDVNSANPTMSVYKYPSNMILYHIAWEQGLSHIRYRGILDNWNGLDKGGLTENGNLETPSSGYGFTRNTNPSITVINTHPTKYSEYDSPKLTWVASYYPQDFFAAFRDKNNSQPGTPWNNFRLYYSMNETKKININRTDLDNLFAFVFSEDTYSGLINKYVKSTNLSTVQSLNSQVQDLQISNGIEGWDGMDVLAFNNSALPYNFSIPETILMKNGESTEGRGGSVSRNDAEFYFCIYELALNGITLKFKELNDSVIVSNNNILNTYLETLPITVSNNSTLEFNLSVGVSDSIGAVSELNENEHIKIKIELIDTTGVVLSTLKEIQQSKDGIYFENKVNYSANLSSMSGQTIKLRMVVNDNLEEKQYSLTRIHSSSDVLNKKGSNQIELNESNIVTEYLLEQNYPNPFNPLTAIFYSVKDAGLVSLKVFDILGREVAVLVNDIKDAGNHSVEFNASDLPSGVYIYTLQVNGYTNSKKMLLLK